MKKYGIIVGVAAFIGLAIFINARVNGASKPAPTPSPTLEIVMAGESAAIRDDYFDAFRTSRENQRGMELEYLETIILEERTDVETLADAQRQKLSIVENMEKEFTVEQLLKAKGFKDVAVTVHQGSVNVIIKADALTDQQIAQVLDITCRETGEKAKDVKVSTAKE